MALIGISTICVLLAISSTSIVNVLNDISFSKLLANMEDYTELCRTPTVQPGTYLIYYRMSNFTDNIGYQIRRSDNGQYVSVLAGQNGMDVTILPVPCSMVIVARNRGGTAFTVNASGNNRLSVMRIK